MKRLALLAASVAALVLFNACQTEYSKLDTYTYYTEQPSVTITFLPDDIALVRDSINAPYIDSIMWFNDKRHWINDTLMGDKYVQGNPYEISYTAQQVFQLWKNHTLLYFPCVDEYSTDGGVYDFQFHYCPTNTEPKTKIKGNEITINDAMIHGIGYYGMKHEERTDVYQISFDDISVPYHVSDKSIHYTFCTNAQYSIKIDGNMILNMPCHITVISIANPQ